MEKSFTLWDVARGREVLTVAFDTPGDYLPRIAFAPDGRTLASCVGKEIHIYDVHAYDEDIERWLREAGVEADLPSTGSGPELVEGSSK